MAEKGITWRKTAEHTGKCMGEHGRTRRKTEEHYGTGRNIVFPRAQSLSLLLTLVNLGTFKYTRVHSGSLRGFSLEHPQGVGIVGIVGTVGTVGISGIEFCCPEPQPTTPSILVDISSYSYLKEQTLRYT